MNKTNSRDVWCTRRNNNRKKKTFSFFKLEMVAACDFAQCNRRNKKIKLLLV